MTEIIDSSFQQGRALARSLVRAELTPAEIRQIPAQQLYVALLCAGEEIIPDIAPFIGQTQYQLLLDFDFWERDSFLPNRFVKWLENLHSENSLVLFHQLIEAMPSDVLELASQHYIEAIVLDEKSENPPGPGWFTPDNGQLWLRFKVSDESQLRILGQFYAYLFQTSAEMFYQLMLNLNSTTSMELEERSLEDRQRRLLDSSLPDIDSQLELQTMLPLSRAVLLLRDAKIESEESVEIFDTGGNLEPLSSFVSNLSSKVESNSVDELLSELAQILNTGLLVYGNKLDAADDVQGFQRQVKGLVNLGLELLATDGKYLESEIKNKLGFKGLYRLGLSAISNLRALILAGEEKFEEELLTEVKNSLLRPIPLYPKAWVENDLENFDNLALSKPIEHLSEVERLSNKIVVVLSIPKAP